MGMIIDPYRFGCSCTPAYVTGNRTGSITVTSTLTAGGGSVPSNLVDGAFANNSTDSYAVAVAEAASGKVIKFDFGVGASIKITEAKWYQQDTTSHGSWRWQGSNNDADWTDIGVAFTLGGATLQTQTQLSGNVTGYRYYRLLGVSGNFSDTPWNQEVEFNQCAC